jgi:hypothetical protein
MRELAKLCNNLTSTFLEKSPPCTKEMKKTVQNFVKILSPIAEKNLGVDISKSLSKAMNLTPRKCHEEKRNRIKRRRCPNFSRLR